MNECQPLPRAELAVVERVESRVVRLRSGDGDETEAARSQGLTLVPVSAQDRYRYLIDAQSAISISPIDIGSNHTWQGPGHSATATSKYSLSKHPRGITRKTRVRASGVKSFEGSN